MVNRVKPTQVSDPRQLLSLELRGVIERRRLEVQPTTVEYVVDLVFRYIESDQFFVRGEEGKLQNNVLAELFGEYMHGEPEKKRAALRRLGDICMLMTGFFSDSLKRKIVDVDYYFGMGGSAYWQLSLLAVTEAKSPFQELAVKFKPVSNALEEMSERSGLHSNSDILRLYEKWLLTGSDHLRSLLASHGIGSPVSITTKTRH